MDPDCFRENPLSSSTGQPYNQQIHKKIGILILEQDHSTSIKLYVDNAALISDCLKTYTKVLQQLNQKALDLLSLQSVCPICLMTTIIVSRELSYQEALLDQLL